MFFFFLQIHSIQVKLDILASQDILIFSPGSTKKPCVYILLTGDLSMLLTVREVNCVIPAVNLAPDSYCYVQSV